MATRIITNLIDDLDGKPATETVEFALDGIDYSIDLSAKNAARLRKIFTPYTDAGVKVPPARKSKGSNVADASTTAGRAVIRAWAKRHMFGQFPNVSDRGRIPVEVIAAYRRAHGLR